MKVESKDTNNKWYVYNNTGEPVVKEIGDYNQMLKYSHRFKGYKNPPALYNPTTE